MKLIVVRRVRQRKKQLCHLRSNFGRKFACDSIHSWAMERRGTFGCLNRGLVMGPAYPPDSKQELIDKQGCLDESLLREERFTDDEHSDDVVSLLEENARLRGIVVKLTDIILKNVADRG